MASTSKSNQSRTNQQPTKQRFPLPKLQETLARLEAHGCKVQQANGANGFKAQCPAHEDSNPSLSVSEGADGKVLLHCFAGCEFTEILTALGFDQSPRSTPAEIKPNGRKAPVPLVRRRPAGGARALPAGTVYHYEDADGKAAFAVVRKDGKGGKSFSQWTPSGDGWLPVGPKGQRPLYRLPELLEWDGKVVIVEGEKCVEAAKTEFPTNFFTTFSGGSAAWKHTDFSPLRGREVTLIADADQSGRDCMLQLAAHLWEIGAGPIKIALPDGSDGSDGSDIVEWIEQGIAEKQLKKYLRPWNPPEETEALLQEASEQPKATFFHKDAAALAGALVALGVEVRYNARSQMAEHFHPPFDSVTEQPFSCVKWEPLTDLNTSALRDVIERKFSYASSTGAVRRLAYSDPAWVQVLNVQLHKNQVDPFIEWVESLGKWDGTERLKHVLSLLLGSEGELAQWAGKFLFLGPVQRAYEPGCKMDEMPVLIGPQGIGKSAVVRQCLPPEQQDEGFSDGLNLAAHPKERAEALQGKVYVEASEMAGATRAELESLKAFVSRQNDGSVRLAYRRNPESTPRRCVIIGTSNNVNCLPNDPTGNRRFVPVHCPQGSNIEVKMAEIRDQLWAEALDMYNAGERANLARSLHETAKIEADGSRRRDEILEDKIEKLALDTNGALGLGEIATKLHLSRDGDVDMGIQHRLAGALVAQGWTKKRERKNGKQQSNWYAPTVHPLGNLN